jgi:hypothetical protein
VNQSIGWRGSKEREMKMVKTAAKSRGILEAFGWIGSLEKRKNDGSLGLLVG